MIFLKKIYIILNDIFLKSMHLYVLLQNLKIRIEQGHRSLVLSEKIVPFTVILQLVCHSVNVCFLCWIDILET